MAPRKKKGKKPNKPTKTKQRAGDDREEQQAISQTPGSLLGTGLKSATETNPSPLTEHPIQPESSSQGVCSAQQDQPVLPADVANSPLFSVPAEIHNMIYRLVLVKPGRIKVTSTGYDREAVVSASKTIRSESLQIYYYENQFRVMAPECNIQTFLTWQKLMKSMNLWTEKLHIRLSGDRIPHWSNLLRWLRLFHSSTLHIWDWGSVKKLVMLPTSSRGDLVVAGMFVTVKALRTQPWAKVKEVLKE